MKSPVIAKIVESDLCIGCGMCAGICPQQILKMEWNLYGEYNPVEHQPCSLECGLCLKVCPFANNKENEDTIARALYGDITAINHTSQTGYYLASFVGYSQKHRTTSASGGLMTWILERLLLEKKVDYVICVAPTGNPEKLFSFQVFGTIEDLKKGSGSAYYPVEMSGIIQYILITPGKYAITGLPCFIKALRLAQNRNKKLEERIVVTLGLTCGQLKNKHFSEYVSALAGVNGEVTAVRYRGKDKDKPASNYYYLFRDKSGKENRIFWNYGISEAWVNRWFTPNACNFCDDVFAECADVTFMDAWLPEYLNDFQGTSLVLVRSLNIQEIVNNGIQSGEISVNAIPVQKIIQSQDGLVQIKKHQISYHLFLSQKKGLYVPIKREPPKGLALKLFLRKQIGCKEKMRGVSRTLWTEEKNQNELDLETFRKGLDPYLVQLKKWEMVSRFFFLPVIVAGFAIRKMRGFFYEH